MILALCSSLRRRFAPHERLGLAHGQPAGEHLARDAALRRLVGERQQRSRVAHVELTSGHLTANIRRQAQQPQIVRDGRAVFSHRDGNGVLRQAVIVAQAAVGLRFLDRVQIFALDVLDEGHFEQLVVGDVANRDGDFEEAGALGRAPTALAGDDLVVRARATDENRLNHPVTADRLCEFFEPRLVERHARLARIRDEQIEVELERARLIRRAEAALAPPVPESARSVRGQARVVCQTSQ